MRPPRRVVLVAAMLAALLDPAAGAVRQAPTRGAASHPDSVHALLARARAALGGEARLSSVERFTANGAVESWSVGSAGRGYSHFEIACELPDAFVRTRHAIATRSGQQTYALDGVTPLGDEGAPSIVGFDGDRLIQPKSARMVQGPHSRVALEVFEPTLAETHRARLDAQQEFLRVTLPIFAASFPAVPVRFERVPYDPQALWVTSPGATATILAFDPVTDLPVRFGDFSYGDYRVVDGVMVPFTTTHDLGGHRQVWKVSGFRVDAPIPPKIFGR